MALPEQDAFAIGDEVEVVNMPDSGMNGLVGTLKKTCGKGRWALNLHGDERSKVLSVENLRKCATRTEAIKKPRPTRYYVVGTWDDWEPNEMSWNTELNCFEYLVTITEEQGCENFKLLLNEDWDQCIYPDKKDANPYVEHGLKGPDDGGVDEEWTIGYHPSDEVEQGSVCKIRLFVSADNSPNRVSWEVIKPEDNAGTLKPEVKLEVKGRDIKPDTIKLEQEPPPKKQEVWQAHAPGGSPLETASLHEPDISNEQEAEAYLDALASQRGGQYVVDSPQKSQEEEVIVREREARERLARRLEASQELLAIRNEGTDLVLLQDSAHREAEERNHQVVENRERYRRSMEENRPKVLFGGLPAAKRAEELVADGSLSPEKARLYVEALYRGRC